MRSKNYPNLSEKFRRVYKHYFDNDADPEKGLTLVDQFLSKYPYYPEALIFKARLLIALNRYTEALELLQAAKRIDEWRINYAFEEAEILYNLGKKQKALKCLNLAIETLLNEIIDGATNFLLATHQDQRMRVRKFTAIKKKIQRTIANQTTWKS